VEAGREPRHEAGDDVRRATTPMHVLFVRLAQLIRGPLMERQQNRRPTPCETAYFGGIEIIMLQIASGVGRFNKTRFLGAPIMADE
jgi:hypothetical protein